MKISPKFVSYLIAIYKTGSFAPASDQAKAFAIKSKN
jgi:hypothetical protein